MTRMTPSEAFVETLLAEGVKEVIGLVGSAYQDALDLFPEAGIRFVTVHNEQTASHMADGYARASGRPGVCIAQNGPGCTNMLTGIAVAYQAHSPVIAITPTAMSTLSGLDGLQETDQMQVFKGVTRYQTRVPAPGRMAESMRAAFRHATSKFGPSQVDIPRDFFYGDTDQQILQPHEYRTVSRAAGDPAQLAAAAELLAKAHAPAIVAGYGCVLANAHAATAQLAEHLTAPVINTFWHNDSFPSAHPLSVGPLGFGGAKSAMEVLMEADVVLMLGSRINGFGYAPQYGLNYYPRHAKIIQVDISAEEIGRTQRIDVGIVADARLAAEGLLQRLGASSSANDKTRRLARIMKAKKDWVALQNQMCESTNDQINPYAALRTICGAIDEDTIVTTDIGFAAGAAHGFLGFQKPRKFIAPGNFANCGFAFPTALGAKLACPDSPVVAIVGDGAWGFGLQEVMTSIEEKLPVVAVVLNNGQLGAEKSNQLTYLGGREVGVNVAARFNYAEIAKAMGAQAIRITRLEDIESVFLKAVASNETWVIEVMIDPAILNKPFRGEALSTAVRYLDRYKHLSA